MDELLINPATRRNLKTLLAQPPHAVLLYGPAGSGKTTLAQAVAVQILGLEHTDNLANYPYYKLVEPTKGSVSIEEIRSLQQFLQLRTPGTAAIRRIVILTGTEVLTAEGQNAFLKTLEEPPADTVIILTAASLETVLPTIQSRATPLRVLPVSQEQANDFYVEDYSPAIIRQAWALAQGQAGLLHALLNEADEHELSMAVGEAKQLLAVSQFERLARVDEYSKDKLQLDLLLAALSRIAQSALEQAALQDKTAAVKRWHAIASHLNAAKEATKHNANTKLLLTDLMLNL